MKGRSVEVWYQFLGYLAQWGESQSRTGRVGSAIVPIVGIGLIGFGAAGVSVILSALSEGSLFSPVVLIIPVSIGLGLAILIGYVQVWLAGYIVTRRMHLPDDPGGLQQPRPPQAVWVSGIFQLEGRRWQRFICLPCQCARQSSGDLVFYQNVDASTYMMGLRVVSAAGIWTLSILPGSSELLGAGVQYWSGTIRPSIRLRVHHPKRTEEIALSCGTASELRGLVRELMGRGLLR